MCKKMRVMRTKIYIIALLSVVAVAVNAQTFQPATIDNSAIQSQQIMMTGNTYNGTVYEPFSNVAPSEYNSSSETYSPAKAPGGPRKVFDIGGDTPPGPSPIGDALLPLLLMAAAFAGWSYLRRRKQRLNAEC